MPKIGEEILTARDPEIRMIFVTAGNPVCQAPSPEVAKRHALADGGVLRITSPVGATLGRVRVSDAERSDTVVFPRGRWLGSGSSANLLPLDMVSKVGNGAPYYETMARLEPVDGTPGAVSRDDRMTPTLV